MARMLDELCSWLEHTSVSETIQSISWIVPTVQTIHIVAITVVSGSILMINLRLIGVFAADQPLKDVSSRFLPFVWWPLLVLLATGAIMIIGEPPRSLKNPAFQLKMTLLVAAIVTTAIYQRILRRNPAFVTTGGRAGAAALASVSMLLWVGIIFAGRWIAYYY